MMILVRYVPASRYKKYAVHTLVLNAIHRDKKRGRYTLLNKRHARLALREAGVGDTADVLLDGCRRYPFTMEEMQPLLKSPANDR